MNTTTHDIRASYTIDGTGEWHEVDINGDDFGEITADMLDFWNGADNIAEGFIVDRTFSPDDYTTVTEITGHVYGYRDGAITTDVVDTITAHITAEKR